MAAIFAVATPVGAQSAAELIAAGDREGNAFRVAQALGHYEAAITLDSLSAEAYGKASRSLVDIGEVEPNDRTRASLFDRAAAYARRAVVLAPNDAESHFHLARALGRKALSVGVRERIGYARDVREHALRALELEPRHPGAAHVLGVWHAEVMRLNAVSRAIARRFLGGQVFGTAKWTEAVRLLELAVSIEPKRAVHRLDLARIYRDVNRKDDARREYQAVIAAPRMDVNDALYKREAADEMRRLQGLHWEGELQNLSPRRARRTQRTTFVLGLLSVWITTESTEFTENQAFFFVSFVSFVVNAVETGEPLSL